MIPRKEYGTAERHLQIISMKNELERAKTITTQYFQNEKIEKILKVIKKELENPITSYTILKRKNNGRINRTEETRD